jgi:hypothetical protein
MNQEVLVLRHRPELGSFPDPGEWVFWDSRLILACPGCGQLWDMSHRTIGDDGTVAGSIVCSEKGCSFHRYVRLDGWLGRPR